MPPRHTRLVLALLAAGTQRCAAQTCAPIVPTMPGCDLWSAPGLSGFTDGTLTTLTCADGSPPAILFGSQTTLTCTVSGATANWGGRQAACPPCAVSPTPAPPASGVSAGCTLPPPDPCGSWSHAGVSVGFTAGQTTTLTCPASANALPVFGQSSTLTCRADGNWDHIAATCTGCPPPPPPCTLPPPDPCGSWSHAGFSVGFTAGQTTTLTCPASANALSMFGQSSTLTCGADGNWDQRPATCAGIGCPPPPPPPPTCPVPVEPNGAWSASPTGTFSAGSSTSLTCNAGFQPSTAFNERTITTCGASGQWTSLLSTCLQRSPPPPPTSACAAPRPVSGGSWTPMPAGGFQASATATLTCHPGYQFESGSSSLFHQQPTLTCNCPGNGGPCNWDSQQDRCVSIAPPPPTPVGATTCTTPNTLNGRWSPDGHGSPSPPGGYAPGDTARLVCQAGYSVEAIFGESAVLTCGVAGQWTSAPDRCLPSQTSTTCTLPQTQNGVWSPAPAGVFVTGATTALTCNSGYIVSSSIFGQQQTLTCGTHAPGQWAGRPYSCIPPPIPATPQPPPPPPPSSTTPSPPPPPPPPPPQTHPCAALGEGGEAGCIPAENGKARMDPHNHGDGTDTSGMGGAILKLVLGIIVFGAALFGYNKYMEKRGKRTIGAASGSIYEKDSNPATADIDEAL
jgi:hypothetical protein